MRYATLIPLGADPRTVAILVKQDFDEAWIRLLIKHFDLKLCEMCGDPTCTGEGVPADPYDSTHADGACICSVCGMEFRAHDLAADVPGCDGPFLTRLCDGSLVKL